MSYKETDIVHGGKRFWVCRQKNAYTVYQITLTHSVPIHSFSRDDDGLSLAIAYAKYKDARA